MNFDRALAFTLSWEGGYVDHPNDPGGETNFGISKRQYPSLDIKALNILDASAIYRRDYWDRIRGDDLPPKTAMSVFDLAVNSGRHRAARMLQSEVGATIDGKIGPKTLEKVKQRNDHDVAWGVLRQRVDFLLDLVENPQYRVFLRGWMRRCFTLGKELGQ